MMKSSFSVSRLELVLTRLAFWIGVRNANP